MTDGKCIIVCRACSTAADMVALAPFGDYAARGKWASAHTKGTGHDSWLCLDGWPLHDAVREYLFPPRSVTVRQPPFRDLEDERAELAAAITTATHIITGVWPEASRVAVAVNALHDANAPVVSTDVETT